LKSYTCVGFSLVGDRQFSLSICGVTLEKIVNLKKTHKTQILLQKYNLKFLNADTNLVGFKPTSPEECHILFANAPNSKLKIFFEIIDLAI